MTSKKPLRPRAVALVHTEAETLCSEVTRLGWIPVPCPVLFIRPVPFEIGETSSYDALLLTSVHAVPMAARCAKPVIVVGQRTAEAAIKAGLEVVGQPVVRVRDLLGAKENFRQKKVIHLAGADVSPDTPDILRILKVKSLCVYEAAPVECLAPDLEKSLLEGELAAVLIFSARAAEVFTRLANRATTKDPWRAVTGIALSEPIAAAMASLPFASIKVAPAPHRNSILEVLGHEQFSQF